MATRDNILRGLLRGDTPAQLTRKYPVKSVYRTYHDLNKLGLLHVGIREPKYRYRSKNGYVEIMLDKSDPFYSMAGKRGRVYEHRLEMAEKVGRCLEHWEIVHHINGIKDDNRPENLELINTVSSHVMLNKYCAHCKVRDEVKELQKQVGLLKWQVSHLNKLLYGTEEPTVELPDWF